MKIYMVRGYEFKDGRPNKSEYDTTWGTFSSKEAAMDMAKLLGQHVAEIDWIEAPKVTVLDDEVKVTHGPYTTCFSVYEENVYDSAQECLDKEYPDFYR